jgi:hypothetical protein
MPRAMLDQRPEMRADVSSFLKRSIGVDLTRIEGGMLFFTDLGKKPLGAGILLLPSPGNLKKPPVSRHLGVGLVKVDKDLFAAVVPEGLLFGDEPLIKLMIETARGKRPGLSARSQLAAVLDPGLGDADLVVAVAPQGMADKDSREMGERFGIRSGVLTLSPGGLLLLTLSGDAAKLDQARVLYQGVTAVAVANLKSKRDAAQTREDFEALGDIMAYHGAQQFLKEVEPHMEGDKLVSRYQLPKFTDSNGFVSMVGVMAAVAIPAFTKYFEKSKAAAAESKLPASP